MAHLSATNSKKTTIKTQLAKLDLSLREPRDNTIYADSDGKIELGNLEDGHYRFISHSEDGKDAVFKWFKIEKGTKKSEYKNLGEIKLEIGKPLLEHTGVFKRLTGSNEDKDAAEVIICSIALQLRYNHLWLSDRELKLVEKVISTDATDAKWWISNELKAYAICAQAILNGEDVNIPTTTSEKPTEKKTQSREHSKKS